MKTVSFYGNHPEGFDRIPEGTPRREIIPDEAWRGDCNYALSPYWDGCIICEMPEGCDFSEHPPRIVQGFKVVKCEVGKQPLVNTAFGSMVYFQGGRLLEIYEGEEEPMEIARIRVDQRFTWEQVEAACHMAFHWIRERRLRQVLCGHEHCVIGAVLDASGIEHSYSCSICNLGRNHPEVGEIIAKVIYGGKEDKVEP